MLFAALLLAAAPGGFDATRTDCGVPAGPAVAWDVAAKWGGGTVTQAALAQAVAAANAWWAAPEHADQTIVLRIPAGRWRLAGTVDLTGLNAARPAGKGWLVFAGHSMNDTVLDFADVHQRGFEGRDVHRLQFCNLHLTRDADTVSQGVVTGFVKDARWNAEGTALADPASVSSAETGDVVIRVDSGFPGIDAIHNPASPQGRFIRKFRYSGGVPVLLQDDNRQSPWVRLAHLPGGNWVLGLARRQAHYAVGDRVAIKSKLSSDMIWLAGGGEVTLRNIRLTRSSRILFRRGLDHIHVDNLSIERMPAVNGLVPFLSTAEGGTQLGQPGEGPLHDVVVEHVRATGTGDDPIALFNVDGGVVRDVQVSDSFGRGIYLDQGATRPCVEDAVLDRSPIQTDNPAFAYGCVTAKGAPRAPEHLMLEAASGRITLRWTGHSFADFDGYTILRAVGEGQPVAIATGIRATNYADLAVLPGTRYRYTVVATDRSRRASPPSGSAIQVAR